MRVFYCLLALFWVACRPTSPPQYAPQSRPAPTTEEMALASLSESAMYNDVAWLSSSEQQGRGSLSEDAKRVAAWIAAQWTSAGLTVSTQEIPDTNGQVNVLGVLPGSEEVILLCAHYDHEGVKDGQIYHGADDNASGVSILLALARALAPHYRGPTLVFLAAGAEERGLLGSLAYVKAPLFPLEKTRFALNFDMVGRNLFESAKGREKAFAAVGAEDLPALKVEIEYFAKVTGGEALCLGANLLKLVGYEKSSDDFSFRAAGVPAVFFSTSMHPDYHKPTDTLEKIKPSQLLLIAKVACHILFWSAQYKA